jgi:hypothetical protein
MKPLFIILVCLAISTASCKRNSNKTDCTTVTITNAAPTCNGWGIIVNGTKYPSRNIPLQYQQNNLIVCATYVFYEDPAMCPCCGGTYADIKSMQ